MRYPCTNCPAVFYNFAASRNHELANEYRHLTYADYEPAEEFIACSLRGCYQVTRAADAVWTSDGEDPYCSLEHAAEGRMNRAIGFYGAHA